MRIRSTEPLFVILLQNMIRVFVKHFNCTLVIHKKKLMILCFKSTSANERTERQIEMRS